MTCPRPITIVLFLCVGLPEAFPATLVEVYPITDTIVCAYVSDGYVDHSGPDDVAVENKLDLDLAAQTSNYSLQLPGGGELQPTQIGRKSKGMGWVDSWPNYPWVLHHWIYLVFDAPLQNGLTYTLQLDGLVSNGPQFSFTVGEARTEAIHVNQIGMNVEAPLKFAYVYHWMGDLGGADYSSFEGTPFHLREASTGAIAFSGQVEFRSELAKENGQAYENDIGYYGADVWQCDFSAFQPGSPGEFFVEVEGLGRSFPFLIGPDAMRDAFLATLRGLYHHRSGPARDLPHSDVPKPVDHMPGTDGFVVYASSALASKLSQNQIFRELPLQADTQTSFPEAWGGHFDAGDWDRNARHLKIPQFLLESYELKPQNFGDAAANVPESGNGIPDIVDEARWSIDFFERTKRDGGAIPGVLETTAHPHGGDTSWTESLKTWYLSAPEPLYTYHYAAVAALLAYVGDRDGFFEPAELSHYRMAAVEAWNWAETAVTPSDIANNTDGLTDYRALAAAQLFKLTADPAYQAAYQESAPVSGPTQALEYGSRDIQAAVGAFSQITHDSVDAELLAHSRASTVAWAKANLATWAEQRACRMAFHWWGPTIVGIGSTTPEVMPLIYAWGASDSQEDRDFFMGYIATTCDYFLGGNPLNKVWVTRLGDRPVWAVLNVDQRNDDDPDTIPGIVPYGFLSNQFHNEQHNVYNGGYGKKSCYPNDTGWATNWPIHELHFENRYPPMTAEYTVHQNSAPAVAAYGFMCGEAPSLVPQPMIEQSSPGSPGLLLDLRFPLNGAAHQSVHMSNDLENWSDLGGSADWESNFGQIREQSVTIEDSLPPLFIQAR